MRQDGRRPVGRQFDLPMAAATPRMIDYDCYRISIEFLALAKRPFRHHIMHIDPHEPAVMT